MCLVGFYPVGWYSPVTDLILFIRLDSSGMHVDTCGDIVHYADAYGMVLVVNWYCFWHNQINKVHDK
jgi:hypothetical protein